MSSSAVVNTYDEETEYFCLDIWRLPLEFSLTALSDQSSTSRKQNSDLIQREYTKKSIGKPFAPNSLTEQAPISLLGELAVVLVLSTIMGGALFWPLLGLAIAIFGSWTQLVVYVGCTSVLALHPMPDVSNSLCHSWILKQIYSYFSYRFVYTGKGMKMSQRLSPWLGVGVPHGVMPFSNLLSTPACQSLINFDKPKPGREADSPLMLSSYPEFIGCPASVVFHTPFLRYFTLLRSEHVSRAAIEKQLAAGNNIGLVGDGIAGIFQCSLEEEVIALKNKKGLAKLALRNGRHIIPCYSFGNTEAFSLWYDSFGWMEWISRKAQASLFFYWGKFGLPIPHRVNITMAIGDMIEVEKVENPTQAQIDEVHQRILDGVEKTFNTYKNALGWGHKRMRFV
uniref:Acyltransferase n=1 Tax=Aplanochytrium stocchinoi TaxID=215587 RepID=A0A7S3LPF2_9STRA